MASDLPDDQLHASSQSPSEGIDAICREFESAWLAGQQPRIEDYLERFPDAQRSDLLNGLLLSSTVSLSRSTQPL